VEFIGLVTAYHRAQNRQAWRHGGRSWKRQRPLDKPHDDDVDDVDDADTCRRAAPPIGQYSFLLPPSTGGRVGLCRGFVVHLLSTTSFTTNAQQIEMMEFTGDILET